MARLTVVDTNILVDHLRGLAAALDYMDSLDGPHCSEISRAELLRGLRPAERGAVEELFAVMEWVPLDERIARRAGELGQQYLRSHSGIGLADLIVSATALELDQPLATLNVRHFPMFQALRPPY